MDLEFKLIVNCKSYLSIKRKKMDDRCLQGESYGMEKRDIQLILSIMQVPMYNRGEKMMTTHGYKICKYTTPLTLINLPCYICKR